MVLVQASRVDALDERTLRRVCDGGLVTRGVGYLHDGRVDAVVASGDGRRVHGQVRGSGDRRYACWAELRDEPRRPGHSTWSSGCACPMARDCTHVVALVLTASRSRSAARAEAADAAPGSGSGWRGGMRRPGGGWHALDALADDEGTPVALQLVVTEPPRSAAGAGPTITATPLVQGAGGGWIRTGISWTGIDPTSYQGDVRAAVDPLQVQALQEMVLAVRARRTGYGHGSVERITLADMGASCVPLLRAARRAGVAVVDERSRPVTIPDGAGHFELSLETAEDGEVTLRPLLVLPDGISPDDVVPVGMPAVAVHQVTDEGLAVVELDPPLTVEHETLMGEGPIVVPADEWPAFVLGQLPALRRRVPVRVAPDLAEVALTHARLLLHLTPQPGHRCEVELGWRYAVGGRAVDVTPAVRREGLPRRREDRVRDPQAERAVLERLTPLLDPVLSQALSTGVPWQEATVLDLDARASIALAEVVRRLRDDPDVVVEEVLPLPDYVEAEQAPVISFGVDDATTDPAGHPTGASARGGAAGAAPTLHRPRGDWFDLDVSVTVGDEQVPLPELIVALTTGQDVMVLPSGTWFPVVGDERLAALASLLQEARGLQDDQDGPLRVTAFQAGLWDELEALGVVERQSERWRRTVDALRGLSDDPRPVPSGVRATLRPYQQDGYQWLALLWDARLGGILADDMGLGKTLQTLAMVQRAKDRGELDEPVLIVAPTSVVGAWADEAERWTPDLRVVTVDRTMRKARTTLDAVVGEADVVVSTYALVRIDEGSYLGRPWSGVVLDEAQFVKNHQAKTYQVVRRLDASVKIAITGTPLENSLMDLWSLLSVAAPGLYPSPKEFKDTYVRPIEAGEGGELLDTLRRRVRPFMLRRTKEQVARELPPKQEQTLAVPLHDKHRAVYDTHLQRERQRLLGLLDDDFARNRVAILRALTTLRQLALHPGLVDEEHRDLGESAKIDLLVEHLRELAAEGHRALVFSQFTSFLTMVRERLEREGITCSYLDGRTRDRAQRIEEFRQGDQPAFLISLKAGGFGLTLTEADYVYVLDPWWNPAAEVQAIDRTHRIGQDRSVTVYRFVSADTVEDKVVALQQRKRELFAQVVDEGDVMASAVTADDIRALLS